MPAPTTGVGAANGTGVGGRGSSSSSVRSADGPDMLPTRLRADRRNRIESSSSKLSSAASSSSSSSDSSAASAGGSQCSNQERIASARSGSSRTGTPMMTSAPY